MAGLLSRSRGLPRLELLCFGTPAARLNGREPPAELRWTKHLGFLVYLALSPGRTRTRDQLLGAFWSEHPEKDARHNLNQTISRLRQCLGADRLRSQGETVVLNDAALEVDALQFDVAAARDPAHAAALLRGDFLEGFAVDDAPAFDDWASAERRRYRARAALVLVADGERRLGASQFREAADAARRALTFEAYHEPAARLLMRAAALSGDSAGALAAFHDFGARLAGGLNEQPSRGLTGLAERIRRQAWRPPPAREAEPEPPLVGRAAVHREAFEVVAAGLADGPRTLLVTGAPGMGRTRLVAECLERLALDGALVAQARPVKSDHDAPWSTLRLLLRAALPQAPGLTAAHADALSVVAWFVPELADRFTPREPADAAHLASALAAVFAAIAGETPLGLAIDDAHLSDGPTLAVLLAAFATLRAAPVVLVLAAADGAEPVPAELLQLRGEIGRQLRGAAVHLDRLSVEEMLVLVAQLAPWCKDHEERDRLARRLDFETSGNPFFAVTLLGGLRRIAHLRADFTAWPPPHATFDTPLPFSLPNLARAAIAARVAELDEECRRVLSAASIAGVSLDLDLIATLAELPRGVIENKLAAVERRQLITFDGRRYAFASPLVADAVRTEALTAGQQQRLRQRAVAALEGRDDLEGRVLRAELLSYVDPGPGAFAEAAAVARAARATGSARTVRRALGAAERAARRRQSGADLMQPFAALLTEIDPRPS